MGLRRFFRKDPATVTDEAFLMTIYAAFNMDLNISELINPVGAGGKASTMVRLAQEFSAFRKKVLVTTTTDIAFSETPQADHLVIL